MTNNTTHTNRLINEQSGYLLQHAYNPVDWYPWGKEAFAKAKAEDKPVFLSVGYSACHWCHVMAHESFEDENTAELLNEHFVSVKVDREERPDVDEVYMNACQAMTGSGGWPLSVFMTPDKKPFFAGTYFPPRSAYGRAGFPELLERIAELWHSDREKLIAQGEKISEALGEERIREGEAADAATLIEDGYAALQQMYDARNGGFSRAPKFPMPHYISFLLAYDQAYKSKDAVLMAEFTLEQMYRGGIFDHVGYGFSRYSTDETWLVPHFEKMLYDNALLLKAYSQCYAVTGNTTCREAAQKICAYVLRDMRSPEGAFFSAQDADSEGEEGRFYTWEYKELQHILTSDELAALEERYHVTPRGNFEGRNILHLTGSDFSDETGAAVLSKLYDIRQQRVPPFKDTKISASWNGLMIEALADAGMMLGEGTYIDAAKNAADFIIANMMDRNGTVSGIFGKLGAGLLADHANIAAALLSLYTATLDIQYLERAVAVADAMTARFFDYGESRFYMTSREDEALFMRPRDDYDGAMPSGAACAMVTLVRLHQLTGQERFKKISDAAAEAFSVVAETSPASHVYFLFALLLRLIPHRQIVICASRTDQKAITAYRNIAAQYHPFTTAIFYDRSEHMKGLFSDLDHYNSNSAFAAYVCENYSCGAPVSSPEQLIKRLHI